MGELISKSVGTSPSHVVCLGKPYAHCNKGPMSGEILGTIGRDPRFPSPTGYMLIFFGFPLLF